MIFYGKHFIDKNDIKSVTSTLKSSYLTQGPKVETFENNLKKYFGAKYCCAVSNGTAALHLSVLALQSKNKDCILVSPITFLASANAILYSKAKPVFVDIDPKNYCIDMFKLEKQIKILKKKKIKVKAVIATDYAGQSCDWHKIKKLSKKYNFVTINDNCHSLGTKYLDDHQYACKYADIVIQSYHPLKTITTGEGGSILTKSRKIFEKVKLLRSHGVLRNNFLSKKYGNWFYSMKELGFNYRLSDIHASLGISQLKKINKFVNRRRYLARKYDELFSNKILYTTPYKEKYNKHSYHLYPLKINFKNLKINKIFLFKFLEKKKIRLQVHYIPIHLQEYYKKKFNYKLGDYPVAEDYYKNTLSLPIFFNLKTSQQERIFKIINTLCLKNIKKNQI